MISSFTGWLKQPYSDDMDAWHWFYFFGLLIVISVMWGLILRTITREIS